MDKKQEEALHNNFRTLVQTVIAAGMSGTPMHERILELGPTPQLLIDHGFPELPLIIKAKTIDKICFDHGIPTNVIERMPKLIATPTHLFKSNSPTARGESVVVVTIEVKNAAPIIIAVQKNKKTGRRDVNEIASMYAKEGPNPVQKWSEEGLLLWDGTKN